MLDNIKTLIQINTGTAWPKRLLGSYTISLFLDHSICDNQNVLTIAVCCYFAYKINNWNIGSGRYFSSPVVYFPFQCILEYLTHLRQKASCFVNIRYSSTHNIVRAKLTNDIQSRSSYEVRVCRGVLYNLAGVVAAEGGAYPHQDHVGFIWT